MRSNISLDVEKPLQVVFCSAPTLKQLKIEKKLAIIIIAVKAIKTPATAIFISKIDLKSRFTGFRASKPRITHQTLLHPAYLLP